MAHTIPSIPRLAFATGGSRELETLEQLTRALPDDYTVFHGVHWTREYESSAVFGEIDFVVLNRSGDILVIEQKNGTLAIVDGRLHKAYEDRSKDVVAQVHRSIDGIRDKFQWQNGRSGTLRVDYLIYCPDDRIKGINAAGLDASRVVDAADRESLPARVERVLGRGVARADGWYGKVHEFFRQSFQVVPDIHAYVAAGERTYVRQAGSAPRVLANLEMSPYRLRFSGAAGSGKSLLACSFFESRANQGKRVLLTCFNRPLADRLKTGVGHLGEVNTWYGFLHKFLQSRGVELDFSRPDPAFWQSILERVMAEPVPDEWLFDAAVVDEAQDFEGEWLEILRLFLRDDADVLVLEDPDQNLQGRPPMVLNGFVGYRCRTNYRSPLSIARFIRATMPFDFESGCPIPGLGVGVHRYDAPEDQSKLVAGIVHDLTMRGFSHDDIVVLTCRGVGVGKSALSNPEVVERLGLRRFEGYSPDGRQLLTKGRLTFDSVYRFKGQQAPAVILADVVLRAEKLAADERLVYCGMTRATVRLDLLVRAGEPQNARFLDEL